MRTREDAGPREPRVAPSRGPWRGLRASCAVISGAVAWTPGTKGPPRWRGWWQRCSRPLRLLPESPVPRANLSPDKGPRTRLSGAETWPHSMACPGHICPRGRTWPWVVGHSFLLWALGPRLTPWVLEARQCVTQWPVATERAWGLQGRPMCRWEALE